MKNKISPKIWVLLIFPLLVAACSKEQSEERRHYFLKGYDELEFRDANGGVVPPQFYIRSIQLNGQRVYRVRDTSLTLVHKITDEPYDGYIRTFHRDRFNLNLQGEFEDGKMFRLRYWHPNRTLGMDVNYEANTRRVWDIGGNIVVESNEDETYYYYPDDSKNVIKEIISDTMRSYYDRNGDLERYTKYTDTSSVHYYPNGQKRVVYYRSESKNKTNWVFREWHPNGQLKLKGRYKDGVQVGVWVKYDSLGNVIERNEF